MIRDVPDPRFYMIPDSGNYRITDPDSGFGTGFWIWLMIRKYHYQIKSKLHRKNTLFTKWFSLIVHMYHASDSIFHRISDSGFYRIPKILSEFQISGIPVASLIMIYIYIIEGLKNRKYRLWGRLWGGKHAIHGNIWERVLMGFHYLKILKWFHDFYHPCTKSFG